MSEKYEFRMQLKALTVKAGGQDDQILRLNHAWFKDKVRLDFEPAFVGGDTVQFTIFTDDAEGFPLVQADLYFTLGKPLLDGTTRFSTMRGHVSNLGLDHEPLFGPFEVATDYQGVYQFNVWVTDKAEEYSEELPAFASLDPEMIVGG